MRFMTTSSDHRHMGPTVDTTFWEQLYVVPCGTEDSRSCPLLRHMFAYYFNRSWFCYYKIEVKCERILQERWDPSQIVTYCGADSCWSKLWRYVIRGGWNPFHTVQIINMHALRWVTHVWKTMGWGIQTLSSIMGVFFWNIIKKISLKHKF